jgi:sulfonate transport system substrate-binding protein
MRLRGGKRWEWLFLVAALLLAVGGAGCALLAPTRVSQAAVPKPSTRMDPARVYAGYRFDSAPNVLSFGMQPLWIPTCVIWEKMARDKQLQADMRRMGCRLDAFAFFKGQDVNKYLRSGQLQGGIGGDLPALKAATEFDVRIVSLIQQGPCSIIAREAIPLSRLRGLRIGYALGSNAHYTLLRVLREHRLGPTDVHLVPLEVFEMADALAAGRIDAFSAWEPAATLALLDHPDFEVLARTDARGFLYFTRAFYERQPAVVRAMVAAEGRALRWLGTNDKNVYIASRWAREHAVAFGGAELPLTAYDFLRLAHRDILRIPTAPHLEPELLAPSGELEQQFRLARAFDLISAHADWERVRRSFVSVGP